MRLLPLLLSAALATTAATQSVEVLVERTVHHGDIVTTKRGLTLPAGEFTIAEMIDAVAGYLCRNYLYDPTIVTQRQSIVLQRSLALDALGSEEVLYGLLASRNLAALPLDEARGIYQIVPLEQNQHGLPMATIPWRRPQDVLRRPHFRELLMTSITLQNLEAGQVADALRSHFSMLRTWQPGAPGVSLLGERAIMLHGYGDQVGQIIEALRALDHMAAPSDPPLSTNAKILERIDALEREVRSLRQQLAAKK